MLIKWLLHFQGRGYEQSEKLEVICQMLFDLINTGRLQFAHLGSEEVDECCSAQDGSLELHLSMTCSVVQTRVSWSTWGQ